MSTLRLDTHHSIAESPGDMGTPNVSAEWKALLAPRTSKVSVRGLAELAGISPTTASRLMTTGESEAATIRKVAQALGVTEDHVRRAAGLPMGIKPYEPPREAHLMTQRQRDAVSAVIRAMVTVTDSAAGGEVAPSTPSAIYPPVPPIEDSVAVVRRGPKKKAPAAVRRAGELGEQGQA